MQTSPKGRVTFLQDELSAGGDLPPPAAGSPQGQTPASKAHPAGRDPAHPRRGCRIAPGLGQRGRTHRERDRGAKSGGWGSRERSIFSFQTGIPNTIPFPLHRAACRRMRPSVTPRTPRAAAVTLGGTGARPGDTTLLLPSSAGSPGACTRTQGKETPITPNPPPRSAPRSNKPS